MATNNLKVTELDFDAIKENLKTYLKNPTINPTFQDYDFDSSALSVLIDLLAYNTHYNAYYLNMVANESFLDTAKLRESVVSHAKTLGYTPYSVKSSVAFVNLELLSSDSNVGELIIPEKYKILSSQIDGVSYNFHVLDDVKATKSGSSYYFENIPIYEGESVTYNFNYYAQTNPKQIFKLPEANIDTTTIKVVVLPSAFSSNSSVYSKVQDVLDVSNTSEVYFLQETKNGQYEIYFGDGIIGKKLTDGSLVQVSYLVTNGSLANKANTFLATSSVVDSLGEIIPNGSIIVTSVSEAAGGSDRQGIDSIKYSAITKYSTQNRLVTYNDYSSYISSNYPNVESLSVWGGEDESPPVYGKVFISIKPKDNYYISETEKQRIIDDIIGPKSIVSIQTLIKDPEYLYVKINNTIKYDSKKTIITPESLKTLVKNTIVDYFNLNVSKFNSIFALSKMQEEIDNSNDSIVGIESNIRLEKKFRPILSSNASYNINFNTELYRGSVLNRLTSNVFDVFDNTGTRRNAIIEETPESFTGISDILVTNPGSGYYSTPTVTITGDGVGATATAKIVNGKIESFTITNRGINYSRAVLRVEGGGGYGATGAIILNTRFGVLRTVYFDNNAERQIINNNAGTINYDTGEINLTNLQVLSTSSSDGLISINVQSEKNIIKSIKNTLIVLNPNDASSIVTNLTSV
jgi:hypothetical protein